MLLTKSCCMQGKMTMLQQSARLPNKSHANDNIFTPRHLKCSAYNLLSFWMTGPNTGIYREWLKGTCHKEGSWPFSHLKNTFNQIVCLVHAPLPANEGGGVTNSLPLPLIGIYHTVDLVCWDSQFFWELGSWYFLELFGGHIVSITGKHFMTTDRKSVRYTKSKVY